MKEMMTKQSVLYLALFTVFGTADALQYIPLNLPPLDIKKIRNRDPKHPMIPKLKSVLLPLLQLVQDDPKINKRTKQAILDACLTGRDCDILQQVIRFGYTPAISLLITKGGAPVEAIKAFVLGHPRTRSITTVTHVNGEEPVKHHVIPNFDSIVIPLLGIIKKATLSEKIKHKLRLACLAKRDSAVCKQLFNVGCAEAIALLVKNRSLTPWAVLFRALNNEPKKTVVLQLIQHGLFSMADVCKFEIEYPGEQRLNVLKWLIEYGFDPNEEVAGFEKTNVQHAIVRNDTQAASLLLQASKNMNVPDKDGCTLVHYAAGVMPELLPEIIARGGDVNKKTIAGISPLRLVYWRKKTREGTDAWLMDGWCLAVRVLVANGAIIDSGTSKYCNSNYLDFVNHFFMVVRGIEKVDGFMEKYFSMKNALKWNPNLLKTLLPWGDEQTTLAIKKWCDKNNSTLVFDGVVYEKVNA